MRHIVDEIILDFTQFFLIDQGAYRDEKSKQHR